MARLIYTSKTEKSKGYKMGFYLRPALVICIILIIILVVVRGLLK
jgi:hypothetical protein